MSTGTFIVSLDCEGKWGMADSLQPYHHRLFTDAALGAVYDRLVHLFARYDIAATFAYVMAFTLEESERSQLAPLLERQPGRSDPWLRHYWAAVEAGQTEGWFQPHALDVVRADGRHEIACHSFCHRPLGNASISADEAEAELRAVRTVAEMKKLSLKTFIFPRNEVGHLEVVHRSGFLGYREKLVRPANAWGRVTRLAEEFNIWPAPQRSGPVEPDSLVRIPAGYFFNWRFGARRYVPLAVTITRWKQLLRRVSETGGVAHLWLHPHNLITGPDTAISLEAVLAHVAELRRDGRLNVMTQQQYCETQMQRIGTAIG